MSMPTDADLMRVSDAVRGSYILFEREHKSLVCILFACCVAWMSENEWQLQVTLSMCGPRRLKLDFSSMTGCLLFPCLDTVEPYQLCLCVVNMWSFYVSNLHVVAALVKNFGGINM